MGQFLFRVLRRGVTWTVSLLLPLLELLQLLLLGLLT